MRLSNEKIDRRYGENQASSQIRIIADGFNIPEETARKIVNNMTEDEICKEYMVKASELHERKIEKVVA